ncbi:Protein Wnt-11 [Sarracenia purpurea var. burkii]
MSTAALTFTISRECSRSSISSCGCSAHPEDPPTDNFKWGGCGDNFQYASQFSKQFDAKKKPKPAKRTAIKKLKYSNYQNDQPPIQRQNTNDDANDVSLEQNTSLLEEVHNHNGDIGRNVSTSHLSTFIRRLNPQPATDA